MKQRAIIFNKHRKEIQIQYACRLKQKVSQCLYGVGSSLYLFVQLIPIYITHIMVLHLHTNIHLLFTDQFEGFLHLQTLAEYQVVIYT